VRAHRVALREAGVTWAPGLLAFSTDGRSLVLQPGRGLQVFRLAVPGRKVLEDLGVRASAGHSVLGRANFHEARMAVARDGRVFLEKTAGDLWVVDASSGQARELGPALASAILSLLLSTDERVLLVVTKDTIALLDARTGKVQEIVLPPSSPIAKIRHMGNEIRATYGCEFGEPVLVRDRPSGAVVRVEPAEPFEHSHLGADFGGTVNRLRIACGTRSADETLCAELLEDGELRVAETKAGRVLRVLRPKGGDGRGVSALAFSPDGRELACGCDDGSILIYAVPRR